MDPALHAVVDQVEQAAGRANFYRHPRLGDGTVETSAVAVESQGANSFESFDEQSAGQSADPSQKRHRFRQKWPLTNRHNFRLLQFRFR